MRELILYNFFPQHLNLYGDRGNLLVLQKRCEWRNIRLHIKNVTETANLSLKDADMFFWGGGGDREQRLLSGELFGIRQEIKRLIEDGAAALAICGGYQLLGQYYQSQDGLKIKGIELFDYYTKGEKQRFVGDLIIESGQHGQIIGFENHSGRTFHQGKPFGKVVHGFGNNGVDKTEGFCFKNVIGTYLHGPLLPKNPQIADQLILWALNRKFGDSKLMQLEEAMEEQARIQTLQRLKRFVHLSIH